MEEKKKRGPKKRLDCEFPRCHEAGCDHAGRSKHGYCKKHAQYRRIAEVKAAYTSGELTPDLINPKLRTRKDGYVLRYAPWHQLSMTSGYVLEHRYQAHEKYGAGDQKCHWCDTALTWKTVEVDHLDWVRGNNDPANLVTACKVCNNTRKTGCELEEPPTPPSPTANKLMSLARSFRD
jgi:hypothetical protein